MPAPDLCPSSGVPAVRPVLGPRQPLPSSRLRLSTHAGIQVYYLSIYLSIYVPTKMANFKLIQ